MSSISNQPSKVTMDDEEEEPVDPKLVYEQQITAKREGLGEMPEKLVEDFGFSMNRLHDPCNYDHTTLDNMLATYKFRDLEKSKIYRIAKKIFGDKMDPKFRIRNRTFNLTGIKDGVPVITGNLKKEREATFQTRTLDRHHVDDDDEDLVDMNDLRLRQKQTMHHTVTEPSNKSGGERTVTAENLQEYSQWYEERRKLRADLNSLGLSESWLRNKTDRTEMENMLYQEMLAEQHMLDLTDAKQMAMFGGELPSKVTGNESLPRIRRPTPIAIRKLDVFLKTNKLRLVDIFSAIDKDKNWNISRDEFRRAVEQYGLGISPSLLEDLITTLDINHNGELSYKELVKGLELYQMEKRELKKKGISLADDMAEDEDEDVLTPTPIRSAASSRQPSGKKSAMSEKGKSRSATGSRAGQSRASSATTLLEAPQPDLQESRLVMKSSERQVDLRKRDKSFLKYLNKMERQTLSPINRQLASGSPSHTQSKATVFKTGYKPVDDHCKPSRLEGETGAMINDFRQLKLKEYYNIMKLCDEQGVTLSRKLLDRVLLHPGDKPTRLMLRQGIRQPGANLPLSKHFADPPKRPRTPIEIRNKGKIKRGIDGELMIDYKHRFPCRSKAAPVAKKVQLSTGKALVSRKVDCWLTFEEYEAMTENFYTKRYVKMEPDTENSGLTWPGYMLDKMRIYLSNDRTGDSTNPLFHEIKREPKAYHGCDNDLNNWQVSDAGYLRQGDLRHPKKFYDTSNLQPNVKPDTTYKNHFVHKHTAGLTMHTKNTQFTPHY